MNDYRFSVAQGKVRAEAIKLHYQRYREVGFFKNGEEDEYEKSSTYFVAQALPAKDVVGVTRLIFTKIEELPTVQYFQLYDIERARLNQFDRNQIAEISAFTKLPAHDVGMGLIKAVLQYSLANGIGHWICCIDERVYHYMHRMFKFPFKMIGAPKVYLGSNTIPCLLNLSECLTTLSQHRPALYEFLNTHTSEWEGVAK